MEFRILGPLEVHDDGGPVRVPGAKERALLADLLVNAGRVVSVDRLVEDLWGDDPPGNPANTLQGRVSALRRALDRAGTRLVAYRPPGYRLAVDPERVDAARFERLVAQAGALAPAEAVRLEELRLAAVETLAGLRLAAGEQAGLVGHPRPRRHDAVRRRTGRDRPGPPAGPGPDRPRRPPVGAGHRAGARRRGGAAPGARLAPTARITDLALPRGCTVEGTAAGDQLAGGSGADVLSGGPGDDTLAGGPGPDHHEGGTGDNRCPDLTAADTANAC